MINYFKIRNFLSLKDAEYYPLPVTFFVGRNNSGKSNLFKALKFLKLLVGRGADDEPMRRKLNINSFRDLTSPGTNEVEIEIKTIFPLKEEKVQYVDYTLKVAIGDDLQIKSESLRRRVSSHKGRMAELLDKKEIPIGQLPLFSSYKESEGDAQSAAPGSVLNLIQRISSEGGEAYDSIAKKAKEFGADPSRSGLTVLQDVKRFQEVKRFTDYILGWRFFRMDLDEVRQPAKGSLEELSEDCSNLSPALFGLKNKFPDKFASIVKKMTRLFPELEDVEVTDTVDGKFFLNVKEVEKNKPIPAWLLSDGILWFLALLTILETGKLYSLVCIDEPEAGIYPAAQTYLGQILQAVSEDSQIFISTHSPYLLQAFDTPAKKSIAFVTRNKEEGSIITPFDARKDLQAALNQELTWEDIFRSGLIEEDQ